MVQTLFAAIVGRRSYVYVHATEAASSSEMSMNEYYFRMPFLERHHLPFLSLVIRLLLAHNFTNGSRRYAYHEPKIHKM